MSPDVYPTCWWYRSPHQNAGESLGGWRPYPSQCCTAKVEKCVFKQVINIAVFGIILQYMVLKKTIPVIHVISFQNFNTIEKTEQGQHQQESLYTINRHCQ